MNYLIEVLKIKDPRTQIAALVFAFILISATGFVWTVKGTARVVSHLNGIEHNTGEINSRLSIIEDAFSELKSDVKLNTEHRIKYEFSHYRQVIPRNDPGD